MHHHTRANKMDIIRHLVRSCYVFSVDIHGSVSDLGEREGGREGWTNGWIIAEVRCLRYKG